MRSVECLPTAYFSIAVARPVTRMDSDAAAADVAAQRAGRRRAIAKIILRRAVQLEASIDRAIESP